MARTVIDTEPVQVAWRNPKRRALTVQMLPTSVVAGNTGLVFGKWGSAPVASITSNTWDFVLNAGSGSGTNLFETTDKAAITKDLWLISDTAGQVVDVTEQTLEE